MDKKNLIIIVLSILLVSALAFVVVSKATQDSYQKGIFDASLMINKQIISNIIQNGQITVFLNENQSIRLIPEQTCLYQLNQSILQMKQSCSNYINQLQQQGVKQG